MYKGKLKFNSEHLILTDIYTCGPLITKETTALTQTLDEYGLHFGVQITKRKNKIISGGN